MTVKLFFRALIAGIISLTNCVNYKEIKNKDLKSAFTLNSSATFKGYYYKGSDNDYHYFVSKWNFQKDQYFKLPLNKFTIANNRKFGLGDIELRIDLFKEGNEEFGQNEFYKLYIVKANN